MQVKVNKTAHTCPSVNRRKRLKSAKSRWVADAVKTWVLEDSEVGPIELQKNLKKKYGLAVPYMRVFYRQTRIRAKSEGKGLGGRRKKCGRCGRLGYRATHCKESTDPTFGEEEHWGAENATDEPLDAKTDAENATEVETDAENATEVENDAENAKEVEPDAGIATDAPTVSSDVR